MKNAAGVELHNDVGGGSNVTGRRGSSARFEIGMTSHRGGGW